MRELLRSRKSPLLLSASFGVVFTLGTLLLSMDHGDGLGRSDECSFASGALLATLLFLLLCAGGKPAPDGDRAPGGDSTDDAATDAVVLVGLLVLRLLVAVVLADACWFFVAVLIVASGLDAYPVEMIGHHVPLVDVFFAPARKVAAWVAPAGGAPAGLLLPVAAIAQLLLAWGVGVAGVRCLRRPQGQGPAGVAGAAVRLAGARAALLDPRRIASLPICLGISALLGVGPALLVMHTSFPFSPPTTMVLTLTSASLALALAGLAGELAQTWACVRGRPAALPTRALACRRIAALVAASGLATLAGALIGIEVKTTRCRGICERLNPLIAAVEQYRSAHGAYPESMRSIPDCARLTEGMGVTVLQGEFVRAHSIAMSGIDQADATLYLRPDTYQCNVLIRGESRAFSSSYAVFARWPGEASWVRHTIWASMIVGLRDEGK